DRLRLDETTNSYRLVHSEGDGLSGLVADRYGDHIVIQLYSAGFLRMLPWVRGELECHFPGARIHVRADHRSEKLEGVRMDGEPSGESSVEIREGPCRFLADLRKGHKTGFFLDQRDNRAFAAALARGASVLDCFCYTGGFAIACAVKGECREILAVDLDEKALAMARENAKLNGLPESRIEWMHGDAFDVLRELRTARRLFDMAILDPAKMAATRDEAPKALDAYADMNRLAMGVLRPGGVLVSCSCSGAVPEPDFLLALRCAAREASCGLQIFRVAGAAPDHPFSIHCPEGRYLKVVFSRVFPSPS
ncbi:MAG: class I SAM-dependent rRNA methyltransferase, partial [Planctomycetota bacterium]|nr:class I SAM-dependent rRNA methyltransferase [Planctomycetota bacterium]